MIQKLFSKSNNGSAATNPKQRYIIEEISKLKQRWYQLFEHGTEEEKKQFFLYEFISQLQLLFGTQQQQQQPPSQPQQFYAQSILPLSSTITTPLILLQEAQVNDLIRREVLNCLQVHSSKLIMLLLSYAYVEVDPKRQVYYRIQRELFPLGVQYVLQAMDWNSLLQQTTRSSSSFFWKWNLSTNTNNNSNTDSSSTTANVIQLNVFEVFLFYFSWFFNQSACSPMLFNNTIDLKHPMVTLLQNYLEYFFPENATTTTPKTPLIKGQSNLPTRNLFDDFANKSEEISNTFLKFVLQFTLFSYCPLQNTTVRSIEEALMNFSSMTPKFDPLFVDLAPERHFVVLHLIISYFSKVFKEYPISFVQLLREPLYKLLKIVCIAWPNKNTIPHYLITDIWLQVLQSTKQQVQNFYLYFTSMVPFYLECTVEYVKFIWAQKGVYALEYDHLLLVDELCNIWKLSETIFSQYDMEWREIMKLTSEGRVIPLHQSKLLAQSIHIMNENYKSIPLLSQEKNRSNVIALIQYIKDYKEYGLGKMSPQKMIAKTTATLTTSLDVQRKNLEFLADLLASVFQVEQQQQQQQQIQNLVDFSPRTKISMMDSLSQITPETDKETKKLTEEGRFQLITGKKKCLPNDVSYIGHPLSRPIQENEFKFVVQLLRYALPRVPWLQSVDANLLRTVASVKFWLFFAICTLVAMVLLIFFYLMYLFIFL